MRGAFLQAAPPAGNLERCARIKIAAPQCGRRDAGAARVRASILAETFAFAGVSWLFLRLLDVRHDCESRSWQLCPETRPRLGHPSWQRGPWRPAARRLLRS